MDSFKCSPINCSESPEVSQVHNSFCIDYSSDIYLDPETDDTKVCCGLLIAELVIIVFILCTAIFVTTFVVCKRKNIKEYFKKLKKRRMKALKNIEKQQRISRNSYTLRNNNASLSASEIKNMEK